MGRVHVVYSGSLSASSSILSEVPKRNSVHLRHVDNGKYTTSRRPFRRIIPSVMHSLFLSLIVYVGYYQNFTVREFMRDVDVVHNNIEMSEGNINLEKVKKKDVFKLLSQEEMFKNPDLRITGIVCLLGSNRTYISRIINEEMNTNTEGFES